MKAFNDMVARRRAPLLELQAAVPVLTNEDGQVMPVVTKPELDERTLDIIQQPSLPPKEDWPMGNFPLFRRVRGVENGLAAVPAQIEVVRDGLQLQIEALREAIAAQNPALAMLTTELQATKATQQAEAVKLAANTLADQAQDAWLALVDADAKEAKAQAVLARAEAAANKTALAATDAKAKAQQLQLEAQDLAIKAADAKAAAAQSSGTAALAAANTAQSKADAAQTKADAADAKAVTAQTKADAAQAKAEVAQTAAATATTKADTAQATAATAATNAVNALTNAAAAQATATNAQNDLTTFKARFRAKRMATPAVGLSGPVTVVVPWDVPYADINYSAIPTIEAAGLAIKYISHTKNDVTVQVSNLLGLNVLAGAGTITVTALHD